MNTLLQDLQYGLRTLLRSPWFTAISILSLTLGIGVNTALFSVVNAVLLKTLPYHDPESIVLFWGKDKAGETLRGQVSAADVADWRSRNHVFDEVSSYTDFRPILTDLGNPERIAGAQVGDGFFAVMGGRPLLGRVFTAEEQQEGKDLVVILSYGLWQGRFAGDSNIIGKSVVLSGRNYTIVGVMPGSFESLPVGLLNAPAQFYRPVAEPPIEKERASRHLRAIGRLKPGVTIEVAQREMDLIASQLEQEHSATNARTGVHVVSLREDMIGRIRPALLMLLGAVGLVLLIACANVGNLLLARSASRQKEIAIRSALGAGRLRLIRQFLTESLLLSLAGGILGVLTALWGTGFVEASSTKLLPLPGHIEIDARVLGFTLLISLLSTALFGLLPALRSSRPNLNEILADGGRYSGGVFSRSLFRSTLVIAEVAMALVLLIGAGLLVKSVMRLRDVDPGFRPDRVLTMNVWLPTAIYPKAAEWNSFFRRMLDRIETISGVEAAGVTSVLPVSSNFDRRTIEVEGQPRAAGEHPDVDNYMISSDYLRAMSISLRQGRILSRADTENSEMVVLVSETMARNLWPGMDPIGKRVRFHNSNPTEQRPWQTVIGVVQDVKQYGLDQTSPMAMYETIDQLSTPVMTLVVKTTAEPSVMLEAIRHEILVLDKGQAIFGVATMDQVLSDSISLRRFSMVLLGFFALIALGLAAVGIYGVISQFVCQRTHEIGIRMALGAQGRDVLRLMLRQGMSLTLVGIAIGLAAAVGLTRLLSGLLFGVTNTDPNTFLWISLLLAVVAFLACYVPARRAAKLNPLIALSRG